MLAIQIVPNWFFGSDIALELIFFLITSIVSYHAHKIYNLSAQRETKLFSMSFFLISFSYLIWSIVNIMMVTGISDKLGLYIDEAPRSLMHSVLIYSHMLFFVAGLLTFVYMTFKVPDVRLYTLLMVITLSSLWFSSNIQTLFYLTSSIILIYIIWYYIQIYLERRKPNSLRLLLAFVFIFIGTFNFTFVTNDGLYYVIGHLFQLLGYLLILANLYIVIRNHPAVAEEKQGVGKDDKKA